jgi:hypothetical protein
MKRMFVCIAALAAGVAGAAGASPADGGSITVRNDSGVSLSCIADGRGSAKDQRILLRRNSEWTHQSRKPVMLWCEPPVQGRRYHLVPGRRYKLSRDGGQAIALKLI